MIYKSISYLDFMMYNINKYCTSELHDISYNIIANDANKNVLEHLKINNINHIIYNDSNPNDYYINRIYRAWNYGGFNTDCDVIIFINSDMAFTPKWIDNLIKKCIGPDKHHYITVELKEIKSKEIVIIRVKQS